MTPAEEQLCIQITLCTNTGNKGKNGINPCEEILKAQQCPNKKFQMPEPWSGHLSSAKILYIGSNPSFDCDEDYPDYSWSKKRICDFFENRFKNGKVKNGKDVSVQYWTSLINYTNWINDKLTANGKSPLTSYPKKKKPKKNFYDELNNDVASTEIVHCKSKAAQGFSSAYCKCGDLWMADILKIFKGELIVVLGGKAKDAINNCCKLKSVMASQTKPIIYLPHPSSPASTNTRIAAVDSELKRVGLI